MTLADWRDISILLLCFEAFILMLIPGIVLFAAVKGMQAGTNWLRQTGLPQLQHYSSLVAGQTRLYGGKVAQPFIQISVVKTQASATTHAAKRALHRYFKEMI